MKKTIVASFVTMLAVSNYALASNYIYRAPMFGVKQSVNSERPVDEEEEMCLQEYRLITNNYSPEYESKSIDYQSTKPEELSVSDIVDRLNEDNINFIYADINNLNTFSIDFYQDGIYREASNGRDYDELVRELPSGINVLTSYQEISRHYQTTIRYRFFTQEFLVEETENYQWCKANDYQTEYYVSISI